MGAQFNLSTHIYYLYYTLGPNIYRKYKFGNENYFFLSFTLPPKASLVFQSHAALPLREPIQLLISEGIRTLLEMTHGLEMALERSIVA